MADSDQLLIPDAAKADAKSFELLRVLIALGSHLNNKQMVDASAWDVEYPARWPGPQESISPALGITSQPGVTNGAPSSGEMGITLAWS